MDGDGFKTVYPRKFYKTFFKEKVRPDGRAFDEFRSVQVEVGGLSTSNGSSLVTIGNTKIMCGIVVETTEIKPGEKMSDFLTISVDFPHLSNQYVKTNQLSEESQLTNTLLEMIFKNSKGLQMEDLISCDGKLYQTISCELVCLDYDGCLYDACCLALNMALKNTRLPIHSLNDKITEEIIDDNKKCPNYTSTGEIKKLSLKHDVLSATFALWNNDIILYDPTNEEEELSKGLIVVVMKINSNEYFIHKSGGPELTEDNLKKCLHEANKRCKVLLTIVNKKLNFEIQT